MRRKRGETTTAAVFAPRPSLYPVRDYGPHLPRPSCGSAESTWFRITFVVVDTGQGPGRWFPSRSLLRNALPVRTSAHGDRSHQCRSYVVTRRLLHRSRAGGRSACRSGAVTMTPCKTRPSPSRYHRPRKSASEETSRTTSAMFAGPEGKASCAEDHHPSGGRASRPCNSPGRLQ